MCWDTSSILNTYKNYWLMNIQLQFFKSRTWAVFSSVVIARAVCRVPTKVITISMTKDILQHLLSQLTLLINHQSLQPSDMTLPTEIWHDITHSYVTWHYPQSTWEHEIQITFPSLPFCFSLASFAHDPQLPKKTIRGLKAKVWPRANKWPYNCSICVVNEK